MTKITLFIQHTQKGNKNMNIFKNVKKKKSNDHHHQDTCNPNSTFLFELLFFSIGNQ